MMLIVQQQSFLFVFSSTRALSMDSKINEAYFEQLNNIV